jgi:RNase adaptor protein for sRNA GlmZ degradation
MSKPLPIRLVSTGKAAVLGGQINADLYVDCRVMRNPFRDPVLGGKTGDDPQVQAWILKENFQRFVRPVIRMIELGIETSDTRNSFKRDGSKPFTVAFFCLAGVHRSRGTKNVVGTILKQEHPEWEVEVVK